MFLVFWGRVMISLSLHNDSSWLLAPQGWQEFGTRSITAKKFNSIQMWTKTLAIETFSFNLKDNGNVEKDTNYLAWCGKQEYLWGMTIHCPKLHVWGNACQGKLTWKTYFWPCWKSSTTRSWESSLTMSDSHEDTQMHLVNFIINSLHWTNQPRVWCSLTNTNPLTIQHFMLLNHLQNHFTTCIKIIIMVLYETYSF